MKIDLVCETCFIINLITNKQRKMKLLLKKFELISLCCFVVFHLFRYSNLFSNWKHFRLSHVDLEIQNFLRFLNFVIGSFVDCLYYSQRSTLINLNERNVNKWKTNFWSNDFWLFDLDKRWIEMIPKASENLLNVISIV